MLTDRGSARTPVEADCAENCADASIPCLLVCLLPLRAALEGKQRLPGRKP